GAALALAPDAGPVARIAESRRRGRTRIDLADDQRLLELGRPGHHVTVLVDDDAAAVEDQLVLAADQVAEDDGREVVARALHEHLLALERLAGVVGGGGEVDDDLGPRERLGRRRRARLPDVLADGQPKGDA